MSRSKKTKPVNLTINPNSHRNQYIRLGGGSIISNASIPHGITLYCGEDDVLIIDSIFLGSSNVEVDKKAKNIRLIRNWFQGNTGRWKETTWFTYIRRKMRQK